MWKLGFMASTGFGFQKTFRHWHFKTCTIRKLNVSHILRYGSEKARTIFANRNVFPT